jgi:hypothetical protein
VRSNSGNDKEYQRVVSATPGVGVEKVFTYPAVLGPGTTGIAFTVGEDSAGGSRIPNAAQVAEVEWYVRSQLPGDDGPVMLLILNEDFDVAIKVKWDAGVEPWIDSVPWPPYYAASATPGNVIIQGATSATVFTVACSGGYAGAVQPAVGQHIGLYDAAHARFVRKKILSFTGTGPWTITCDTALSASDTSYTPVIGQMVMPWSESLQSLVTPCLQYTQGFGPGECWGSSPFEANDGQRQVRSLRPRPKAWPYTPGNRLETELLIDAVEDVGILAMTPDDTTVGTLGVSVYLLRLADFAVFEWS